MTITDPSEAAHYRTIEDDLEAITSSDSTYPYDQDDRTTDEAQRHKENYPWLYNEAGDYDPSFSHRPELEDRDRVLVTPMNTRPLHIESAEVRELVERTPPDMTMLTVDTSNKGFVHEHSHMTQAEALTHQEQMFADALVIMKKKRFDYSGTVDPFKNLRDASFVGVNPLQGVMVRIMDKFARIRSYIEEGTLKVNDESVRDTLVDVLNYTCILAAMIEEE